jgi:hypothetical protein
VPVRRTAPYELLKFKRWGRRGEIRGSDDKDLEGMAQRNAGDRLSRWATGAGKTSLLRQLIGSDPDEDRFPSTAPAKTTIADIEVIQDEGDFEAAVTFFTEFQTHAER